MSLRPGCGRGRNARGRQRAGPLRLAEPRPPKAGGVRPSPTWSRQKFFFGALGNGTQTFPQAEANPRSVNCCATYLCRAAALKVVIRGARRLGSLPGRDAHASLSQRFSIIRPRGGRRDAVLGDRDGRAPRLRPRHASAAASNHGGIQVNGAQNSNRRNSNLATV